MAFLAGWESARDLQLGALSGHYLETYVISEIVKSYNARGITALKTGANKNLDGYEEVQEFRKNRK